VDYHIVLYAAEYHSSKRPDHQTSPSFMHELFHRLKIKNKTMISESAEDGKKDEILMTMSTWQEDDNINDNV